MSKRDVCLSSVRALARKFRAAQEIYILPLWERGKLGIVPLWALDTLVLIVKLCSTSVLAVFKTIFPPALKSLHGETILITGAGQGLGRELAIQFAEQGATVVCWDDDTRRNNAVVNEIRKKDGDCLGYTIDVTDCEQVSALALSMRRQLIDVSMVISTAALYSCAPISIVRHESITKIVEMNLLAHFWIIQAFLPGMIERRHGHIIAINSSAGLLPSADMVPYCASRFGLKGLMESMREELRLNSWTKNIHITSVYIAAMSTGLYPPPTHRFGEWFSELTPKDAARVVIEGIRQNRREICIPSFIKNLIALSNLLPYRIRIIFTDFFNFGHRGWFCFC